MFRVDDTQKSGSAIVHYGEVIEGKLQANDGANAKVDAARRNAIRLNHTATHLLHAALKQIVGTHVQQKGSLVDSDRARFDFSHHESLTTETLHRLECLVNEQIRANHSVETSLMSLDEAKQSGAVALFGEKYNEEVRVLSLGEFSKELCGGTHASRTGDIGLFKITAEYGVASGIRRIELVTGAVALHWVDQQLHALNDVSARLKTTNDKVMDRLMQVLHESKQLEKQVGQLQQKLAARSGDALLAEVQIIGDVKLLVKRLDHQDAQGLRVMLDQLKSTLDSAVIVLFSVAENKISVVAAVSKSLLGQVPSAAVFVKHLCGKGGGREDMAQGGGDLPADLAARVAALPQLITPD
jgi:alanyl-tRNA synthetase